MKLHRHFISICLLCFALSSFGQAIKVDANGYVGIKGNPVTGRELQVTGEIFATSYINALSVIISGPSGYIYSTSGNVSIYNPSAYTHVGIATNSASNSALKVSGEHSTYAITAEGNCLITGGVWQTSSKKFKKDIVDLDKKTMLGKVMQLQAKSYYYKDRKELIALHEEGLVHFTSDTVLVVDKKTGEEKKEVRLRVPYYPKEKQFGLIAEEVEPIFPELVMTDSLTTMQAINYTKLIPVLLEAIKEQEVLIENLQTELTNVQYELRLLSKISD